MMTTLYYQVLTASETLDLSNQNLEDNGVMDVVGALANRTKALDMLYLSNIRIGIAGAAALSRLILTNPSALLGLDLYNCSIGDQGMQAFAEPLRQRRRCCEF
jgi:hypothetical protein